MIGFENVGNENGQNRHQQLKFVANTFRVQYPSSTLVIIYLYTEIRFIIIEITQNQVISIWILNI